MVTVSALADALVAADLDPRGPAPLVVEGTATEWLAAGPAPLDRLRGCAVLTIALVRGPLPASRVLDGFDLVAAGPDAWVDARAGAWRSAAARAPQTAAVLAQLLRVEPSLVAESLAYSMLQSGREHAAWLAGRTPRLAGDQGTRVRATERDGAVEISLTRPAKHNAMDGRMRAELSDALAAAEVHGGPVLLTGTGPSFCAGGDLDEFGLLEDPAQAHFARARHAPAARLERNGRRVVAGVHGWCIGAGIELAAFAGRLVAADNARFRLPEVAMGLIPGSGGTVSIRRRIGARALLHLALTGADLDARAALELGLVDEVVPAGALRDRLGAAARGPR